MADDSDKPSESNFDRLARMVAKTMHVDAPGATKAAARGRIGASALQSALRQQGLTDAQISNALDQIESSGGDSAWYLAGRLLERNQQRADEAAAQQARMAEVASRLAEEQVAAQDRDDRPEVDRLSREQRSVEVDELTLQAAEAIREVVVEAVVAAAARDDAATQRQDRMERITWGLLVFAGLTLLASIAAAVAAIVTAANT